MWVSKTTKIGDGKYILMYSTLAIFLEDTCFRKILYYRRIDEAVIVSFLLFKSLRKALAAKKHSVITSENKKMQLMGLQLTKVLFLGAG